MPRLQPHTKQLKKNINNLFHYKCIKQIFSQWYIY